MSRSSGPTTSTPGSVMISLMAAADNSTYFHGIPPCG
jgi:hypothetical protein